MAHHDFTAPIAEAQARALRVERHGHAHGTLYGIRDATQIHMFDRGRRTRFDIAGHAVIHTAPNVRKKPTPGYEPVCVGTTTSDRMERFTRPLMQQYGVRLIIGKGGLREDSLKSFAEMGGRVPGHHRRHGSARDHLDRGDRGCGPRRPQPESLWKFRVNGFGPLLVAMDSHGASLYSKIRTAAQQRRAEALKRLGVR